MNQFSLALTVVDSGEKHINEFAVSVNYPVDLICISSTLFRSSVGRFFPVLNFIIVIFSKCISPLDDVFGLCIDR